MKKTMTQTKRENSSDRVIIVAGGSGGIGSATCRLLAAQGATLVIAGRDKESLARVLQEVRRTSPQSMSVTGDFCSLHAWNELVEAVEKKFQRIDVLVNCIGVIVPGTLETVSEEDIQRVVSTNIISVINAIKAVLPVMRRQGNGQIINVGSIGGILPMPFETLYSATKFAARGLSLSLSEELRGTGVTVSLISPGPVKTKMLDLEATDDFSTITFVEKALHPDRVAEAILRVIRRPKREVTLPRMTTKVAKVLSLSSTLYGFCFPLLSFFGRYRLKRYRRAYLNEVKIGLSEI
jgi:short-subunit dehydrogenase